MRLAWLLTTEECRKTQGWSLLSRKFFEHFRPQILKCMGYDGVEPAAGRVPLAYENFWCDLLGQMKTEEFFGEASFEFITQHVYSSFCFERMMGAVCTEIKTHSSEYSDCIKRFLHEIKAISKGKQDF